MNAGHRRVLIVGPSLRYLGGQAVQAQRLVEGLRELQQLDVEYLVVDPVLPEPVAFLQRIPIVRTIVTSIAYMLSLVARVPRADTVHIFSAAYWSFLIAPTPALLIGRLLGKHVLLNYHSGEADDHLQRWGWHVLPLLRLADEVIVPNDYLAGIFRRYGITSRSIANHVDVSWMRSRNRTSVTASFLCNRNFEAHYNVAAVIDAFALVHAHLAEAHLVIAGSGSLRLALHAQVEALGLTSSVRFTGPVAPSEMPALYAAAHVYVNASLIDNMPLSLLEAFAAGLPVVTSDAGGIPWIAADGDTARVVRTGDVQAMADAMLDAVANPAETLARAARARDFVDTRFSWRHVGPEWERAYAGRAA